MNVDRTWTIQFNLDGGYLVTPPLGVSIDSLERFCEVQKAIGVFLDAERDSKVQAA